MDRDEKTLACAFLCYASLGLGLAGPAAPALCLAACYLDWKSK
jgi:hypothetical protein